MRIAQLLEMCTLDIIQFAYIQNNTGVFFIQGVRNSDIEPIHTGNSIKLYLQCRDNIICEVSNMIDKKQGQFFWKKTQSWSVAHAPSSQREQISLS